MNSKIGVVIVLLLFLLTTSCSSTYFISTLSTTSKEVRKVENGDFLLENDSIRISHRFNLGGSSIQVNIFNKLNIPLYVDWDKSKLIIAYREYSYSSSVMIDGRSAIRPMLFDTGGNPVELTSEQDLPSHISCIPVQTMISLNAFDLSQISFESLPDKGYKYHRVPTRNKQLAKAGIIDYKDANSPMKFRSDLCILSAEGEQSLFSQEFYCQNIIRSKSLSPKAISPDMSERGDIIYLKDPSKSGEKVGHVLLGVAKGVGIVLGGILGGAIDSKLSSDNESSGILDTLIE